VLFAVLLFDYLGHWELDVSGGGVLDDVELAELLFGTPRVVVVLHAVVEVALGFGEFDASLFRL
jgi:hypothetical protein